MRRWLLVATLVAGARPLAPPRIAPPTLGVDYGLRRVGVCVGVGFASRPLEVIEHDEDIDAVAACVILDDFFASADDGAAAPPAPPAPAPPAPPKRRPRPKPRLRYLE